MTRGFYSLSLVARRRALARLVGAVVEPLQHLVLRDGLDLVHLTPAPLLGVVGRIGAENVLVFGTWYRPSAIDARSPEAQTISQGAPLWVFSDGELVEGQWIRTDPLQPFELVDTEGQPILLTPGTTWVELAEGLFSGEEANPIVEVDVLPAG